MGSFSLIHWIILGVVILLLFGGNRFSAMMGDVAKGLKSFKQGMADEDEERARRPVDPRQLPQQQPIDITQRPAEPVTPPPPPPPSGDDQPR